MDCVIELLRKTQVRDEQGIDHEQVESREVFASRKSVTRAEFFGAGHSGLNPEYVFTMFRGDYSGEPLIRYNNKTYAVYRVYDDDSDYIEVYVQREGGANGY